jgi:hypothetical protein
VEGADLGYYASIWAAFLGISSINFVSSLGQRPCELLPSSFVRRPSYVVVVKFELILTYTKETMDN